MSDLFTPPRFFRNVTFHRHTDRSVGWLELFYDLVYVATLIQIGNFLSDNVTLLGFGQFMVLLTVVWWAWTGETFYQNRYVVDDLTHRLLVFSQIFAVATLGLSISGAFGDLYIQFTIAYVITRLILVLMNARAMRVHPEGRGLTQGYVIGFSIGIFIWLGSLILPADYHWVGWLIGITFELLVPQLPNIRKHRQNWGIDTHHISERFGIFTIIVLGESFVKILDDAQGLLVGIDQILFSIFGLIVVYALWWLYFADTADKTLNFVPEWRGNGWVYGHLVLSAGLVAFGVGAKKLFASSVDYPADPVIAKYRLLYTTAIVLYLLALAVIDLGVTDKNVPQNQTIEALVHLVSAVVIAIIGVTMTSANAITLVLLIALVMTVQVGISIYQTAQIPSEVKE